MRDLNYDIVARDRSGPGFNSARAHAKAFNGELDQTARMMNLARTAAAGFAAGFSITAVADFGRYVNSVIDDVSTLVDLSDKVGIPVEDIQRMPFGFEQAGVEAGNIDQILSQWSKRIGEAHTNGGKLAEILAANGVSLTDGNGHLRSSVELMREYADLVENAGSEQEQMTLATTAFGKAGGDMILALKDGKDGFDDLMGAAEEAGGVLDEELARRLEGIGDEMDAMWRRFEIGAKTAIGNAVVFMADLRGGFAGMNADYEERLQSAGRGAELGALAGRLPEATKGHRPNSSIDNMVDESFGVRAPLDVEASNKLLEEAFRQNRDKYRDKFLEENRPKTIIPPGTRDNDNDASSRLGSANAADVQVSAYERVMKKLQDEKELLGLADTARRIMIEQQRAGVEATDKEGLAISALVTKIEEQEAAYRSAAEASDFMRDNLKMTFGDLIPEIDTGNQALDGFINRLSQAAAEAAFFGDGPLAGLFGGSKTGLLGSIFGGGRAIGGGVDPWKDYLVGENGPEIVRIGARGGRVGTIDDGGGQGGSLYNTTYNIDARGADQAAVARLERGLAQRDKTEAKRVSAYSRVASTRGTRP